MAVSFRLSRDGRAHERPGSCPFSSERRGLRDPGMVPRGENPPHPASRSLMLDERPAVATRGATWAPASRRCSSAISSEAGGSGGGARAPDPYLLRVIEARSYGLVARQSGGAECDSAWSGARAPPPLPPAGCARG